MKSTLILAFALGLLGLNSFAAPAIPAEKLKFRFMSNDGSIHENCTHTLKDAVLNDWDVVCGARTFLVHFHLREYTHPKAPHKTVEVAYYLLDRTKPENGNSSSQALWLRLEDQTPVRGLVFHQSVDRDTADLVLGYTP